MVIFGMLSTLPVILISRSLYVCLNFSSHLFDAVNIANSSLLNISFINIASFFNTGPPGKTFLYQAMRISLIKWHCPCLNFFQFSLQNSYPLEELLRSLTHLRRKSYYWNFLYPILKNFKSPGILYFDFCLRSWYRSSIRLMTRFFFSYEQKYEILNPTSLLECCNLQKDLMTIEHSKNFKKKDSIIIEHSKNISMQWLP